MAFIFIWETHELRSFSCIINTSSLIILVPEHKKHTLKAGEINLEEENMHLATVMIKN